jgi:hypothetical protein
MARTKNDKVRALTKMSALGQKQTPLSSLAIDHKRGHASFTAEMLIFVGRGRAADARVAAKG